MMEERFRDRTEAGRALAERLSAYAGRNDVVVLALPRRGLPVALEIATALKVPLDVFVVRKLGVPGQEELAMGAIASGGVRVVNEDVTRDLHIDRGTVDRVAEMESGELRRRESVYRGGRPPAQLEGKVAILVDDGIATGSTMRAAIDAVRRRGPREVIVAVPAAAPSTCREIGREVDEIVCVRTPEPFFAVGAWYEDFDQLTDDDVRRILEEAATDGDA
jgi:putative phosphoribosyl transferase